MMKTAAIRFSALLTASMLGACSTVTVTTDYDKSASFGKYQTYSLAPASKGQTLPPIAEAALRDALHTELAPRGLAETTSGKADLAIVRHVFLEEKVSVQQYTDWGYGYAGGWPYGYGYYGMWAGAPRTYTDVRRYTEGTLILDVVDTRTNKLVFRGTSTALVGGSDGSGAKIRKAVKKMVAALPNAASR